MYNKSWIRRRSQWSLVVLRLTNSIFSIDLHYKTADRTPPTANKVNYDSFCYKVSILEGFIFVKLSTSREKQFKNPLHHHIVKSVGWAGTWGRGQQGKRHWAYSVGRTTQRLETFLVYAPAEQFSLDQIDAILDAVSSCYNTSMTVNTVGRTPYRNAATLL